MKAAFLLFLAAALCSCSINESIITPPVQEEAAPLVLTMNTTPPTKALIKESRLPDPSMVGITVRDPYGAYTGEGYSNVKKMTGFHQFHQTADLAWDDSNCSSPCVALSKEMYYR